MKAWRAVAVGVVLWGLDVVVVTHSSGGRVAPDNGLGGWNLSWSAWTAGSALR